MRNTAIEMGSWFQWRWQDSLSSLYQGVTLNCQRQDEHVCHQGEQRYAGIHNILAFRDLSQWHHVPRNETDGRPTGTQFEPCNRKNPRLITKNLMWVSTMLNHDLSLTLLNKSHSKTQNLWSEKESGSHGGRTLQQLYWYTIIPSSLFQRQLLPITRMTAYGEK